MIKMEKHIKEVDMPADVQKAITYIKYDLNIPNCGYVSLIWDVYGQEEIGPSDKKYTMAANTLNKYLIEVTNLDIGSTIYID